MAGRVYAVQTFGLLSSGSTKTLILLGPSGNVGFKLVELGISMNNTVTSAEPVRFDIYRVTTLGSPAGSGVSYGALDGNVETGQASATVNLTTEPTAVSIMQGWFVQPNSGLFVEQWPLGREFVAPASGQRLGIRYTTPTNVAPTAYVYVNFEE